MYYFSYNIIFHFFIFGCYFLSLFSNKIKRNFEIRKIPIFINIPKNKKKYWFHASSVGEYEQARIVAIKIKENNPNAYIIFSVFSYSGFSQRKADWVHDLFFPLPFDFKRNIKKIITNIQPDIIIYAKYDVWPNMALIANHLKIPQILISAVLPINSKRKNKIISQFYKKVLSNINYVYTIHNKDTLRFKSIGIDAKTIGDTRFDSIEYKINESQNKNKNTLNFLTTLSSTLKKEGKIIIVGGSTYPKSEKFLIEFIQKNPNYFLILVPHHVDKDHITSIKNNINQSNILYSTFSKNFKNFDKKTNILLIDIIGVLPLCYSIADISYVGGAWEGSVHSVIEAAYFGNVIVTGPYIQNSQEALDLKKNKLIHVMKEPSYYELEAICKVMIHNNKSDEIKKYFKQKSGSTEVILHNIYKII